MGRYRSISYFGNNYLVIIFSKYFRFNQINLSKINKNTTIQFLGINGDSNFK